MASISEMVKKQKGVLWLFRSSLIYFKLDVYVVVTALFAFCLK